MSDKGREAIACALRAIDETECSYVCSEEKPCEACIKADKDAEKIEFYMRKDGMLHEDDVVEGKHWCNHYKTQCMYNLCSRHHDWLSCQDHRPATVKDLIVGDKS